jgi:hypothetical protein
MKQLKILGLTMVAAAALMAFVGAGTAAATPTALCKVPTTPGGLPICEGNPPLSGGNEHPRHLGGGDQTQDRNAERDRRMPDGDT